MADPDFRIRRRGSPRSQDKGGTRSQKHIFSTLRASVWSNNKGGPGSLLFASSLLFYSIHSVCERRAVKPRRARLGGKKEDRSRSNPSKNLRSFSSSNVITLEDKILVQKYFISVYLNFNRTINKIFNKRPITDTFEPVYNGPVLSGQFSKSPFFAHTNAVFVTCIRRPRPRPPCKSSIFVFLCYFYLYSAANLGRKLSHMSLYAVIYCV